MLVNNKGENKMLAACKNKVAASEQMQAAEPITAIELRPGIVVDMEI